MLDKLPSYTKYFIFLTTISLLLALPTFASSTKTKTKKNTQTQNQNSNVKLTEFNATIAYNIWTHYYQAREKDINTSLPVFKPNANPEETKTLMAMWDEGKQKAYKNFVRKMKQKAKIAQQTSEQLNLNQNPQVYNLSKFDTTAAYKIWTQYFQAIEKGENPQIPAYRVIDANADELTAFRLKWLETYNKISKDYIRKLPYVISSNQQAQIVQTNLNQPQPSAKVKPNKSHPTDLKVFNAQVARKIWTDYYQAQENGQNPPFPNLQLTANSAEEANQLMAIWDQAQKKAYKIFVQRTEQKDNYNKMQNILKNVGLENVVNLPSNFASPTYDANGNMTSAGGKTYSYDYKNRLIGITSTDLNISLVYNGLGDLVSKTVNGVTTSYLVDRNNITGLPQVVEEIQNGQVIKQYTHGADGLISQTQLIDGQRVTSFYGKDGHGSVRYLTDSNGNITDTYDYDAFGNLINRTGNTPNDYLYAGERLDSDLGFYYLRARFLNTVNGRFLTQDKFQGHKEDPKSLHKYLYVANDPINKVDPTGRFGISTFAASISIGNILSAIPTIGFFQILSPDGNIEFGKGLLNPVEAGSLTTQPTFGGGAQYEIAMGNKYCKEYDASDETLDNLDLSFNLNLEFKYTPNIRLVRDTGSNSDPTSTFFRRSTVTENGQILEILGKFDRSGITINDDNTGKGTANLRFITSPFLPRQDNRFKVNSDGTSKFVFQLAGFNTSGRKIRKSSIITIKCPK
jgi:RHS repeat-associated protein